MDTKRLCHVRTRSRRNNWSQIRSVLRSEDILVGLRVSSGTRVQVEPICWERYWSETGCRLPPDLGGRLETLRSSRRKYIQTRFDLSYAAPFCHAYFSFLRVALDRVLTGHAPPALLHATLGLECAAVGWTAHPSRLAAATCPIKNPVYLLAKLREPRAYEDPKFLPLIAPFYRSESSRVPVSLFYHYRQVAVGEPARIRVLLYPPVAIDDRPEAFRCIQALAGGLARKHDTRAVQRSRRICDLAVGPFLERFVRHPDWNGGAEVRIADLGAGTGDLARNLIERLATRFPTIAEGRLFAWTLVDVGFRNAKRHAHHWPFFQKLASLRCRRSDYVSWIHSQEPGSTGKPFHVILMCRLLNNASRFGIDWVDAYHQVRKLSGGALTFRKWKAGTYLPHVALTPGAANTKNLLASNASLRLRRGTTFRQLSLSDYFRGLYFLTEETQPPDAGPEAVFFPIRQFSDSALLMPDGSSVLEKLCLLADAVIIEDVDLDARALRRHLEARNLTHLAATDATNRCKMRTAKLLCVSEETRASLLPGRRIW